MAAKKVLIVEDHISTLVSYLQILETLDLDIIPFVAATYESARRIFLAEQIDLIILDLVLPDAVATDVLADIRSMHRDVPILLVTGFPDQLDHAMIGSHHICHVFTKPFQIDCFARAIQSNLGRCNKSEAVS